MSDFYTPRRLRIKEPGFEKYSGDLGGVWFEEGASKEPVTWVAAQRIGTAMHIEDFAKPGHQISPAAEINRNQGIKLSDPVVKRVDLGTQTNALGSETIVRYTRAELEAVADSKGLEGVRSLARAWGGTGRSISECIEVVLSSQAALNGTSIRTEALDSVKEPGPGKESA